MQSADQIRKLGFRRWYERQLIESHLWLVSCILGMIVVAVALDVFSLRRADAEALIRVALAFGGGALAVIGWGRYRDIMLVAEHFGDGATCPRCRAYASFRIVEVGRGDEPTPEEPGWMRVRCRKCDHEWTM